MEQWKTIKINNEDTLYEISNIGRCRRVDKINWKTKGILKPKYNKSNGYYSYCIIDSKGKYNYCYIHRLVAQAFIYTNNFNLQINHIDGDKSNNKVDNLEWCTRKENMSHAFNNNLVSIEKEVEQYDLDGNYIKTYKSLAEASRENKGITESSISACCRNKIVSTNGYQWKFSGDEKIIIKNKKEQLLKRNIPVFQYDLNGNFIKEYSNITSCYKELGKRDNGIISQVCKGNRKQYLGYQWRYKESTLKLNKLSDKKEKPVNMLSLEGKIIKSFNSIKEASRYLGREDNGAISRVCKGKKETYLNFKWTYK